MLQRILDHRTNYCQFSTVPKMKKQITTTLLLIAFCCIQIDAQPACPIKGQVIQQCRTCPATCVFPDLFCIALCIPGCGCPLGQLIDEQNMRCVEPDQCPVKECPIEGQVLQGCRTCPATCKNPDLRCTLQCLPGCGCPPGQLIDEVTNRCVDSNQCKFSLI